MRTHRFPADYFEHLRYRIDAGDARAYLTRSELRRVRSFARDDERAPFLANKLLFHQHFRSADVRLPRLLGYSVGSTFFSEGGSSPLRSAADLLQLTRSLVSRSGAGSVFVKPIDGKQGRGCLRLDAASVQSGRVEEYLALLVSGSYLFEEEILQHPALSAIYPHSVNTLRIVTCTRSDGTSDFVSALLRLGANGSIADNASAGGLLVRVSLDAGVLAPYGRRLRKHGGTVHYAHPDTGVEFAGCALPGFASAKEMVRAAAAHLPHRLVGWDVATTPDGPVLIEGNHSPHVSVSEVVDGGYRVNPAFRALLREAGIS